jgi:membrane protein DedA with SNARE-associated domain
MLAVFSHRVVQYMDGNFLTWPDIVNAVGYPATGLGILVESLGVPLPGETLLFVAAAWAGTQHHSLVLVVLLTFIASTIGADAGYMLGFKGGRPFVERFGTVFHIRPDHIARSELFFARHGDRAILAGRFVLGMRTWGSMLAGMSRMPFWRFQLFSALGGLAWALLIGGAGYLVGSNLALVQAIVRGIGLGGLIVLAMIGVILVVAQHLAASRPR